MTVAAEELTYDIVPPRRASLADFGGGTLEDDPDYPPDKTRMPYAAQLNQVQWQGAATNRVQPVAIMWIRIVSGVPTLHASSFASAKLEAGDMAVIDQAAGTTRIEWAASTFPAVLGEPEASITYTTDANNPALAAAIPVVEMITNGVRVRTYDAAGALADANFRIALF